MQQRPVRTLITDPLTRLGVVDEDWKYIVFATIFTLIGSMMFVESFWLMLILTPASFTTGVLLSVYVHKQRPPRWVHHQAVYLLRRAEALAFGRRPGLRARLPGVDSTPLAHSLCATPRVGQPRPAQRRAAPSHPRTRFDALELLPASTPRQDEYREELTY